MVTSMCVKRMFYPPKVELIWNNQIVKTRKTAERQTAYSGEEKQSNKDNKKGNPLWIAFTI